MKKEKIDVTMSLPYESAVSYLEDLLESLKSGTIVVKSGDEFVTLSPAPVVDIEVEAKLKKGKQKFSLELSWVESESGDLTIGSTEPAIPAPAVEKRVPATKEASEVATRKPAKTPAKKSAAQKTSARKKSTKTSDK